MKDKRLIFPQWVVLLIAQRDKYICHVCDEGWKPDQRWTIDHDKARAKGGTNHFKNLRLAHHECNGLKSSA